MFRAILSGKSNRLPLALDQGTPWSAAFRRSEDLLTSTIFERFAYLEGSLLWKILRKTFGAILPNYRIANLTNIEFWPRWGDAVTGGTVEPDVFMQFEVGDPTVRIDLIVEAKLDGQQYAEQWHRQWQSYLEKYSNEGEESSRANAVYLLAIGGLNGSPGVAAVQRLTRTIEQKAVGSTQILAAAADWAHLATAVDDMSGVSTQSDRILEDITEALALFGYRRMRAMSTLILLETSRDPVRSLNVFRNKGKNNE
jgi:hypothetical protein